MCRGVQLTIKNLPDRIITFRTVVVTVIVLILSLLVLPVLYSHAQAYASNGIYDGKRSTIVACSAGSDRYGDQAVYAPPGAYINYSGIDLTVGLEYVLKTPYGVHFWSAKVVSVQPSPIEIRILRASLFHHLSLYLSFTIVVLNIKSIAVSYE